MSQLKHIGNITSYDQSLIIFNHEREEIQATKEREEETKE